MPVSLKLLFESEWVRDGKSRTGNEKGSIEVLNR